MTEVQKKQILKMRKDGLGYKTIAGAVDLSRNAVRKFCKSHGMSGFGWVAAINTAERVQSGELCKNCYQKIKQPKKGRKKKFCSEECRRNWWKEHPEQIKKTDNAQYRLICTNCGREFISYGNKNRKYCSHSCYINKRFCDCTV